jgi:hypothetical protein
VVPNAAVSMATGWSEPAPGRELDPLESSAFSRHTFSPTDLWVRRQLPKPKSGKRKPQDRLRLAHHL